MPEFTLMPEQELTTHAILLIMNERDKRYEQRFDAQMDALKVIAQQKIQSGMTLQTVVSALALIISFAAIYLHMAK